jgi:hypothetical protein
MCRKTDFEEGNEQLITFKITSGNGVQMNGEFKYNTADKVITYLETHYFQENYPILKKKTTDGREFDYKLGDASLIFDFYKKNGSYVPAMSRLEGDKFTTYYKDETHVRKFSREIVYNTFTPSDKKGLNPKIDFNISIWKNMAVKEDKASTTLLSRRKSVCEWKITLSQTDSLTIKAFIIATNRIKLVAKNEE